MAKLIVPRNNVLDKYSLYSLSSKFALALPIVPVSYTHLAISIMSYIIACQGVDKIVKLSVPILNVLYPVAITTVSYTHLDVYKRQT